MSKKMAVLYDFLQVNGGAEAVTLGLCRHFLQSELVTGFVNPIHFPNLPIDAKRLNTLTSPTSVPGWQTIKTCLAFEYKSEKLAQYDTLIFSGSNAPLAVKSARGCHNIYYCHTPPRFIYDLKDYYLDAVPLWQRPLLKGLISYLQPRYEEAINCMDSVYANSKNTQWRLKKYLKLDSEIIYPPCNTARFNWLGQQDYFLSTARLEKYKRVDLIVDAFTKMPDKKLIVTSGGSQLAKLKQLARGCSNIKFTGWVSEEKLVELMGNCIATIYLPKDEDFGMSPVESMGAGKPVVGINEGGVTETVLEGTTGWLLPIEPRVEQIIEVIKNISVEHASAMKQACEQTAANFSKDKFFVAFDRIVLAK